MLLSRLFAVRNGEVVGRFHEPSPADRRTFPLRVPLLGRRMAPVAVAWCVLAAGCSQTVEQSPAPQAKAPASASQVEVTLRAVDAKGFAAAVADCRGKVVLVDYWATWCESCVKLFPHTAALHRDLAGKGLAVISVSFDDAEDEAQARKFLTAQGAAFENLRADSGASPRSFIDFDVANGTLPYLRLYDRSGKMREEFFAPIHPDKVRQAVMRLLEAE